MNGENKVLESGKFEENKSRNGMRVSETRRNFLELYMDTLFYHRNRMKFDLPLQIFLQGSR